LITPSDLELYLKKLGYRVEYSNGEIRVLHEALPLYLKIEFQGRFVHMSIKPGEGFKEAIEDLKDMGEDVEEIVENALSYLNIASLKARQWIEEHGLIPVFKLREGSIEVYEALEEILEEEEEK
jgi:hypothetical protein